jgi:outer membrane biosynthesis protein TonB
MEKSRFFAAAISIGIMTLSLQVIDPGLTPAAEQQSKAKPQSKTVKPKVVKPKTAKPKIAEPKTPEPKIVQPKIEPKPQTAETTANTPGCFGVAPQIEELVPDEGEPGAQVSIKGAEFGSPDCLRGVSFGPGQASTFTMKDESTIVTTVPTGGRKGLVMLTITTASGEDSKVFMVK